ncbi:DUF1992 domain-containing protein [Cohnella xylanilytica]|uniref:DUF1992 domain-containing protein n=1 Tax=Cohnella xylanilytica TaxID=557555 RepID=A0A841U3H5_9BACL|nr:DnaJ family domain-containing protein [Cohnella xylanilytica]MBB6692620.1 DUF1992 domain-containing protein [Cohnella xylanilytica]GIO11915.1 DUF1992 domain-containing protein [Cohnella xylanilytica]
MDWIRSIADERIREAQAKGEFDDLPGKGKPLPPDELASVPEELRMGYRLLKNAGAIPPELELRKEMTTLEDLLRCCRDDSERERLREKLTASELRYRSLMEQRGWQLSGAYEQYRERMESKIFDKRANAPDRKEE